MSTSFASVGRRSQRVPSSCCALNPSLPPPPHSAPLTDPTVCEETAPQGRSVNQSPLSDSSQASSHQPYQPTCSELPFGQQEVLPTPYGPLTFPPSPAPNVPTGQPPPANTQITARSGVWDECMCVCVWMGVCMLVSGWSDLDCVHIV